MSLGRLKFRIKYSWDQVEYAFMDKSKHIMNAELFEEVHAKFDKMVQVEAQGLADKLEELKATIVKQSVVSMSSSQIVVNR